MESRMALSSNSINSLDFTVNTFSEDDFVSKGVEIGAFEPEKDCSPKKYAVSLQELQENTEDMKLLVGAKIYRADRVLVTSGQKGFKSSVALTIGLCVASGNGIGNALHVRRDEKVLYVDTEMGRTATSMKLRSLLCNFSNTSNISVNLRCLFVKEYNEMFNLAKKEYQYWLLSEIGHGTKMVILDNYDGLIPASLRSDEKTWEIISLFLKHITDLGITVFLVHHNNKDGIHRGTGKMTDDCTLHLRLTRPDDCPVDRSQVIINVEDSRYLYGKDKKPFTMEFVTEGNETRILILDDEVDCGQLVTQEEIAKHNLGKRDVAILQTARSTRRPVYAKMFINENASGFSSASITASFKKLTELNMLYRDGEGKATIYRAVSADPNEE